MSEVPFLDSSCLGPDLTTLNEDDLLRYFLNDDLDSPFDSKVPSNSPLLDPPTISLVSPLPKQSLAPVTVKKEQCNTNAKSSNAKSRSKSQAATVSSATKPITTTPLTPPPLSSPVPTPHIATKAFSTTAQPKYTKPSAQIHPITVNATTSDLAVAKTTTTTTTTALTVPPPSLPSPIHEDDKTVKRQRRLLKNRESAQLSRIRKKMYIDELERKVNALVSENSGLREEVVHLNDVLKQVATDGENGEKGPLSRAEIIRAISTSNGTTSSSQARKYAGVCLLVVLFSLGLFLNVVPANNNGQINNRLIELDHNNHNKNNAGSNSNNNSNNNNNNIHFRDYKMATTTADADIAPSNSNKHFSTKRSWDDDDEHDFTSFPDSKRLKNDEDSMSVCTDSLSDVERFDERDPLFDVLEDDAFSEDGILTTSSPASPASLASPTSPPSAISSAPSSPLPASPNSMALVPSTPPASTVVPGTPPSTPRNTSSASPSPSPSSPSTVSRMGVALLVPSLMPPSLDDPLAPAVGVLHVHLWSFMRNAL